MLPRLLALLLALAPSLGAQAAPGPYARIAFLRPLDGQTAAWETAYVHHLDWHREAGDVWKWYGWNVTHGDRHKFFVYATFGHAAADFDHAVAPLDDERDTQLTLDAHIEWRGSGIYEFLPNVSRGDGQPSATQRLEFLMVEVRPENARAFEAALATDRAAPQTETLWFRMAAGGEAARFVRLRPMASMAAILGQSESRPLPDAAAKLVTRSIVEIWTFRPTLSYGVQPVTR
ncbi:MAG TPA: hypothetical protein VFT29_03280 [Gemmatimonadaceae bacterium]|nr:hypothetical protein [Gemmatimonadaceae bacterium]